MNAESLRQQWSHTTVAGHPGYGAMLDHALDLERRIAEARDSLERSVSMAEELDWSDHNAVFNYASHRKSEAREALARIDAAPAAPDDDLDEPLPPKQCGLDDPDCDSCQ